MIDWQQEQGHLSGSFIPSWTGAGSIPTTVQEILNFDLLISRAMEFDLELWSWLLIFGGLALL